MRKPKNSDIIQALNNNCGILVNSATELGCHRVTLSKWIQKSDILKKAHQEAKEIMKDLVEHQLLKNIREGKETSIIFYAKTKMKDRGYSQDPLIQLKNELKINYIEPSPDEAPYKLEEKNNEKE